jgi:hypothetical protein
LDRFPKMIVANCENFFAHPLQRARPRRRFPLAPSTERD